MSFYVVKYKGTGQLAVVKESQVSVKDREGWMVKPSKCGKTYMAKAMRHSPFATHKAATEFTKKCLQGNRAEASDESEYRLTD